jgi:iron complex outermembrane receptor protein
VDSEVNQKTRTPLHASHTFEQTLYYFTGNYKLRDNLAIYAQFATGFLVPDISVFQVPNPNVSDLKPQESKNYQAGVVYHGDKIAVDVDAYYIDFTNKQSSTVVAGETVFSNIGGAVYKGLEGQASYLLTDNLSVFANGSLNSAEATDSKTQIKNAPKSTAAIGLLFRNDLWQASFADKYTGKQWADNGEPAAYLIDGFNTAEAKVSRNFGKLKLELAVYNLFDNQPVVNIKPGKTAPFDQYYYEVERNWQLSAKVNF